jgi:hypothetical protein
MGWGLRMIFGQRLKNVADGGEIWDLALLQREILGEGKFWAIGVGHAQKPSWSGFAKSGAL